MALETENLTLDEKRLSAGVAAVLNDPGKGFYILAEMESVPVASLLITFEWSDWRNQMVWWFQSVYVLPEARKAGIFRKMFAFVESLAVEHRVAALRLYVEKDNLSAQSVYQNLQMHSGKYLFYEKVISQ